MWRGIIDRYASYLPVTESTPRITLGEGNTPLIYSQNLSRETGLDVYLKYEGSNPTASFKDRGMTVAVSNAVQSGARAILCASTGNTSASAAAYGAKAGIPCHVLLPQGAVALGKLSQAMMCRAKVIPIKGNFDDALTLARDIADCANVALVNSVNPHRIEGQKTGAFEICEQLGGRAPDYHLMPVGNAGNITAYWKGYGEYFAEKKISSKPKMIGFQARGAAPIVSGHIIRNPKTVASAICIGNPASWIGAEDARKESGGLIDTVRDDEIMKAYHWSAAHEGLYIEPASAAGIAGLVKLSQKGYFKKTDADNRKLTVVCILTGSGLKDPDVAIKKIKKPKAVRANQKSVLKEMSL